MQKNIKILGILFLVLLLALAVVGTVYYRSSDKANLPVGQNDTPPNPAVMGQLQSSSIESVTLTLQGNATKTFSVSSTTKVVTQVTSGQVGKALSEIAPGATVMVQPHKLNSTVADMISVVPKQDTANQNPLGPTVYISGKYISATANSMTVSTASDPALRISITKDTVILSNVLAGQKGKTLKDATTDMYVQVVGIASTKGPVAGSIQLLVPLQ